MNHICELLGVLFPFLVRFLLNHFLSGLERDISPLTFDLTDSPRPFVTSTHLTRSIFFLSLNSTSYGRLDTGHVVVSLFLTRMCTSSSSLYTETFSRRRHVEVGEQWNTFDSELHRFISSLWHSNIKYNRCLSLIFLFIWSRNTPGLFYPDVRQANSGDY